MKRLVRIFLKEISGDCDCKGYESCNSCHTLTSWDKVFSHEEFKKFKEENKPWEEKIQGNLRHLKCTFETLRLENETQEECS